MQKFFPLNENESIIKEIKPLENLKWYFFIYYLGRIVPLALLGGVTIVDIFFEFGLFSLLTFLVISTPCYFLLSFFISTLRYNKEYYWISNQRIIRKQGIIGYSITSVPLERVSDLVVSKKFLEILLGLTSLRIQSLRGEKGTEISLLGISDAENLRNTLMELIEKRRREKGLIF